MSRRLTLRRRRLTDISISGEPTSATGGPDIPRVRVATGGFGRNLALSLTSSIAVQVLNVVSGVILARSLGPTGRGEAAAILLWPALLVSLGGTGLFDAVVFFSAKEREGKTSVAPTGILLSVAQSLVLMGIGYFVVAAALGNSGRGTVTLARTYLLWIPFYFIASIAMEIMRGRLQMVIYSILKVAMVLATTVGLIAMLIARVMTVQRVILLYLLVYGCGCVASITYVFARGWVGSFSFQCARQLISFGFKSHTGYVSGVANQRGDQAAISIMLPVSQLGLYSVAVSVSAPLSVIGSTIALVAFPTLASQDLAESRGTAARCVRLTLAAGIATGVLLVAASPWLIYTFFGAAFMSAAPAAQLLLVASVLLTTNLVLEAIMKAVNLPLVTGIAETIGALFMVAALWLLIPILGIIGGAVASFIAYASATVVLIEVARRRLDLRPKELLLVTPDDAKWLVGRLRFALRRNPASDST
jgi:O-antigen/teichoic acid export membrane protein